MANTLAVLLFIIIPYSVFSQPTKKCKQEIIRYTNTYGGSDSTWVLQETLNDSTIVKTEYYRQFRDSPIYELNKDTFITGAMGWKKIFKGKKEAFISLSSFDKGIKIIERTPSLEEHNTVLRYVPQKKIKIGSEYFLCFTVEEFGAGQVILDKHEVVFSLKNGLIKKLYLGVANWIREDYKHLDSKLQFER